MTAQLTPRRGRPMAGETLPERVEGHVYGVLTELAYARTALREQFPSHDAAADAAVEQVVRTARTSLLRHDDPLVRLAGRAILAFCEQYATADAAEDAEVGAAAGRVERAAWEGRQGCALIEFAATGRARGRLPRRATRTSQEGLL